MRSFREQRQAEKVEKTDEEQPSGEQTINKLQGMSEAELMATLRTEAAKAKAAGTMDNATLQAFYDQAAPLLTAEQRDKLAHLITMINQSI